MQENLQPDTQKVLEDGEELKNLVEGRGWGIAKERFNNLMLDIGNIFDIKGADPQAITIQIAARQIAIETLTGWIRDIEGSVSQYKSNAEMMRKVQEARPYLYRIEK